MSSNDWNTKLTEIEALKVALGPESRSRLLELTHDPNLIIRQRAVWALARPSSQLELDRFVEILQFEPDSTLPEADTVWFGVARALGDVAKTNPELTDRLLALTYADISVLRDRAARALWTQTSPEVQRRMAELTRDADPRVRATAIICLNSLSPPVEKAVWESMLRVLEESDDVEEHMRAAQALGRLAVEPALLNRLVELKGHDRQEVRDRAAFALECFARLG